MIIIRTTYKHIIILHTINQRLQSYHIPIIIMSSGRPHNRNISTSVNSAASRISHTSGHNRRNTTNIQTDTIIEDVNEAHKFTRTNKLLTISKKGKKLSDKGKYKLADARAQQMLVEWYEKQNQQSELPPITEHTVSYESTLTQSAQQIYNTKMDQLLHSTHQQVYDNPTMFNLTDTDFIPVSPRSPISPISPHSDNTVESYDENAALTQNDIDPYNNPANEDTMIHVWDDIELNDSERLELMRQYCLQQIETEEAKRRIQKHQRKLNDLRNASKNNQKIKDFNWMDEENKWLEKYTNNINNDDQPIIISEPVHVINELLESCLISQQSLIQLLHSESIQYELSSTDTRILHASLDASFNGRRSPLNFRVEMLWRFASTIQDIYISTNRKLLLQLSIYSYHLLIEKCDTKEHMYQYTALCNCLELATIELNRIELREQLHSVNRDYQFIPPDLTKLTFEFKKSKALLAREEAKRKKKQQEEIDKQKLKSSMFDLTG